MSDVSHCNVCLFLFCSFQKKKGSKDTLSESSEQDTKSTAKVVKTVHTSRVKAETWALLTVNASGTSGSTRHWSDPDSLTPSMKNLPSQFINQLNSTVKHISSHALESPVKLDSFPTDNQMKDGGPLYSSHDSVWCCHEQYLLNTFSYSIKRLWAKSACGNGGKQCSVLLILMLFVVSSDFRVSSAVGNVAAVFLFLFLHNNVDSRFCLKKKSL